MSTQKKLNQTALRKLSKALLTYLGFVALAMAVWVGHALSSVRNANIPVRVQYVGIPNYIGWRDTLPEEVNLTLRDAGRRLGYYRHEELQLNIDLTDQFTHEKGEIRISPEVLRRNVTDQLLGTTKLQAIDPVEIRGRYYTKKRAEQGERMTEKSMKLHIETRGVPKGEKLRIFPSEATVKMMIGMTHWGEIDEDDIALIVRYPKNDEDALRVEVVKHNRWIGEVRVVPEKVEYIIEK